MRSSLRLVLLCAGILMVPWITAHAQGFYTITAQNPDGTAAGTQVSVLGSDGQQQFSATANADGTVQIPDMLSGLAGGNKDQRRVVVRKCNKDGTVTTEILIIPLGVQPPKDEKCEDRDAGLWLVGTRSAVVDTGRFTTTAASDPAIATTPSSASHHSVSNSGFTPGVQLRWFGGPTFINGNTPASTGFDSSVLVRFGPLLVGPMAGYQWTGNSLVNTIGSHQTGSTFVDTSAGYRQGNFGGALGFNPYRNSGVLRGGFQVLLFGGASVVNSTVTQASGFCGGTGGSLPPGCHALGKTTTHSTDVGEFVGTSISHPIFPHVAVVAGWNYNFLPQIKPAGGTSPTSLPAIRLHSNSLLFGFQITSGSLWGSRR